MPRKSLADMVATQAGSPPRKTPPGPQSTPPARQSEPPDTAAPLYQRLYRKEARLHESQVEDLHALARTLNRLKTDKGERITENTLIRVAVDLLLQRSEDLHGSSEAELRRSVGL